MTILEISLINFLIISFIENYNKQLHSIFNNHIKSKQYTAISWPLFISLIINEEN